MPVHQRVIESDAQSFCASGVHVFAHQIATRALLRSVVIRELGVPQTEAFMMFSSHHHVLLPGSFGEASEIARRIGLGLELRCERHVLVDRYGLVLHRPLMTRASAVQAPMDEHAKLRRMPPLHALLAIGSDRRRLSHLFLGIEHVCRGLSCGYLLRGRWCCGLCAKRCGCKQRGARTLKPIAPIDALFLHSCFVLRRQFDSVHTFS